MSNPAQPQIAAVISIFNPDESFQDNLKLIAKQCHEVFVVNDGSSKRETFEYLLKDTPQSFDNVTLVDERSNNGIAYALNRGVEAAMKKNPTHIMTFDQDSTIQDGFIETLLKTQEEAEALKIRVGSVSPERIGIIQNGLEYVKYSSKVATSKLPIQSGLLIPSEMFDIVGYFDEDLFIDWVDFDFNYRMEAEGYKNVVALGLNLEHEMGENTADEGETVVSSRSAMRYYYIARNPLLVQRKYEKSKKKIATTFIMEGLLPLLKDVQVNPGGMEKLKSFMRGKAHAIMGKTGKLY